MSDPLDNGFDQMIRALHRQKRLPAHEAGILWLMRWSGGLIRWAVAIALFAALVSS